MSLFLAAGRWRMLYLLCFAVVVGSGCHRPTQTVNAASQLPVAPVEHPMRAPLSNQLDVAGELLPYQEVELHAKVSGYIRDINVDIGDHVEKGQVLAVLEIPELRAQVDEAQAGVLRSQQDVLSARSGLVRAQADHAALHAAYQRLKQAAAVRPGLIAQQELDDAQAKDSASAAQVDVAKADLSAMQQALSVARANHLHYVSLADYAKITAPYTGVITWRYADTGALVQAGTSSAGAQPVVKIAQTDVLRLRLPVPASLASYVKIGDPAKIRIETTEEKLTGKIVRTTGELDLATRTLQVEIDLNNAGHKLEPGMYADVTLNIQRTGDGLTVPVQAVDRSKKQAFAYVVDSSGHVQKRELQLGLSTPNRVEVLSGLSNSDRVVVANLSSFNNGEAVRAQDVVLPQLAPAGGKGDE
ncbi:MAG TPA: efflux RND transporter periplasmic adaptor subunit [Terracidiphilus sp.]|nr:efflux RND transporter periplasmic adaptor subunit [Terracidiphilus sp.]